MRTSWILYSVNFVLENNSISKLKKMLRSNTIRSCGVKLIYLPILNNYEEIVNAVIVAVIKGV